MFNSLIMKFLILIFIVITNLSFSQVSIYNPDADAENDLKIALEKAANENRHVFVQIGGNWCPWCVKLDGFCKADKQIDSLLSTDYVVVKLNYSKEKKNEEILKRLDFPQRFGFPVIVILDGDGNRLHTQNSWYLEEGKSYSREKVISFLKNWSVDALDPEKYK